MRNFPYGPYSALGYSHGQHRNPDSPIKISYYAFRCQREDGQGCCPFCGYETPVIDVPPWPEGEVVKCEECEEQYRVEYNHGYGHTSEPLSCAELGRKHRPQMTSLHYYDREGSPRCPVLVIECVNCEKQLNRIELPDTKEFWDPNGVMDLPVGFNKDKPTPVLDWLRRGRSTSRVELLNVLAEHHVYYG